MGITIAARKYDLNAAMPFQLSDILNIQPVVKHSVPLCSEAKDIVETGKVQLAEVCPGHDSVVILHNHTVLIIKN